MLLTTHYMEEAERLCDRVAVMDHGHIIAVDAPEGLVRAHFAEDAIEFTQRNGMTSDEIERLPAVVNASVQADRVSMFSDDVPTSMSALLQLGQERGEPIKNLRLRRATLEDVFLKLTGRTLRD